MSALGLAFYTVVLTRAFAVRSAAGLGAVLVAMPMLAFVLPVSAAVSITTALTAITAMGIGFGFYFINLLDEHALRRSLGGFLISMHCTPGRLPVFPTHWRRALAAGTGVAGGLLGTMFGAGVGTDLCIYFNALRLEREIFRVTMSTVVLLGGAAQIAAYARLGFYEIERLPDRNWLAARGGWSIARQQGDPPRRMLDASLVV